MYSTISHQKSELQNNNGTEIAVCLIQLLGIGSLCLVFSSDLTQSTKPNSEEEKAACALNPAPNPGADPWWQHFPHEAAKKKAFKLRAHMHRDFVVGSKATPISPKVLSHLKY